MASLSSIRPRNYSYNVFSSFHGPDVRKTLLSHMREQFNRNGITMFDDQKIVRSATIAPSLKEAIKESRISIVILSKKYASSSWCLDELVEILECKKAMGQIVMTIFYGVDPSHVRKQIGDFGISFDETCAHKTDDERQKWSKALNEVGNIAGEDFLRWDNEAKMIEKIAKDVLYQLNATPSRDFDGMVGLETHLRELQSLLDFDNDEAMMVGICGPAGIGKTTISRALQSLLSDKFQLTCFVDNLRENYHSGNDEYGLKLYLQERCLSKVLNHSGMRISHLDAIKENLSDQKVLIILDDVKHINQLEALANEITWFGRGSRIVVTTEDQELLQQHGMDNTYHVKFPSHQEAIKILCRYAFRQSYPHDGFEELAESITYLCGKLPLGLRVVGSSLRGKRDKSEWEDVMRRLENILHRDIEDVLRVGYESLEEDAQTLFLHIAVFFNYKDGDIVKAMFTDSDLNVEHLLNILEKRSLIEMPIYGKTITMHRLLQQVGKKTIRRQKPSGSYQIIIDANDICDVLENDTVTRNVYGISFDTSRINEVVISKRAFKKIPNLRFLKVYKRRDDGNYTMHIPEGMEFPSRLRLLHWDGYPSKCLPPTFQPQYLVELHMMCSKLEKLWDGIQPLANLKKMDLTSSLHLVELPDLSNATNLETLVLSYCVSLVKLPPSVSNLYKLKTLWMFYCKKLEAIPTNWNLASLESVAISGTNISIFDISVPAPANEETASLIPWHKFKYLRLSLPYNEKLATLPQLPANITTLDLSYSGIERISNSCIKGLYMLQHLTLSRCLKLTALPELPPSLRLLDADDCESLETIFYPLNTPGAQLNFSNCFKLEEQARRAIIQQHVFGYWSSLLPGSKMPAEFDHQTIGNTLTFPLPAFSYFKVCLLLSVYTGEYDDDNQVFCRRIRQGYLYPIQEIEFCRMPFTCEKKHLFIFHSELLYENGCLEVSAEMVFEFNSKYGDFDIIECGAKILAYETEGSNNESDEDGGHNHQDKHESGEALEEEEEEEEEEHNDDYIADRISDSESGEESEEEDDEEGCEFEPGEAYKDKGEDNDYICRKRPRKTSISTNLKWGSVRRLKFLKKKE